MHALGLASGDVTLTHAADTLTLSGDTLASLVFAHSGTKAATSTTSASATFGGGVGVAGELYVGAKLTVTAGGAAITNAGAGVPALQVNGVASNLYIDFTGNGNNYLDATNFYIRTFAGSTKFIFDTANSYLTIQGSAAAGFSQTIYSHAGGDSGQFGIGGASSVVGRNFFVYTAAGGFVTTWDAASALSLGKMTVAYTTASTSTTTGLTEVKRPRAMTLHWATAEVMESIRGSFPPSGRTYRHINVHLFSCLHQFLCIA